MATRAVLNTNELSENVIVHMDVVDILRVKRVAKPWKALIDSSIHIQRGLFLAPVKDKPIELDLCEAYRYEGVGIHLMGFFIETIPPTFPPLEPDAFRFNELMVYLDKAAGPQPFKNICYTTGTVNIEEEESWTMYSGGLPWQRLCTMPTVVLSMHITQPPITVVGVHIAREMETLTLESAVILRDRNGITFGFIFDIFKQMLRQMATHDPTVPEGIKGVTFGFRVPDLYPTAAGEEIIEGEVAGEEAVLQQAVEEGPIKPREAIEGEEVGREAVKEKTD